MPGYYVNSWNAEAGGVFHAVSTVVGCGNRRVQVYITPVIRTWAVPGRSVGRSWLPGVLGCRTPRVDTPNPTLGPISI